MIKTIFACGMFFIGVAHAAEQKVFSAHDLQKLGDGIFRGLNIDGNDSVENINLLIAPEEVKREEVLKEIEKAMRIKNKSEVADIYKLVQQASQTPNVETTESQAKSAPAMTDIQPHSVVRTEIQSSSPSIPASVDVNPQPEPVSQPAINSVSRSSGRLDSWIQRNAEPTKTPNTP